MLWYRGVATGARQRSADPNGFIDKTVSATSFHSSSFASVHVILNSSLHLRWPHLPLAHRICIGCGEKTSVIIDIKNLYVHCSTTSIESEVTIRTVPIILARTNLGFRNLTNRVINACGRKKHNEPYPRSFADRFLITILQIPRYLVYTVQNKP